MFNTSAASLISKFDAHFRWFFGIPRLRFIATSSWVAVKNISILTAKDIDSQIRTINRTSVFNDVPDERLYKWQIARAPDQWISALEEDEGFSRFKSLLAPLSQAAETHDHPPPGKRLKSTISPSTSLNKPVHNATGRFEIPQDEHVITFLLVREIFVRNILWARDILEQLLLSNDGPTQTVLCSPIFEGDRITLI